MGSHPELVIGQYQVREEIGSGGMATVYRAWQPGVEREVAIKVLPPQFMDDPVLLARFHREAGIASRLQHPRILPIFDYGEADGQPFLVMPFMPTTLAERIASNGKGMKIEEVLHYASQIAEGLDYLHKQGIVHRDFKPSNVLIDESGDVYLTDFGIAQMQEATVHLTATGLLGTPQYMAPEMFMEGKAVPATDIYALGVTLYEMLTGQCPFESESPNHLMLAHFNERVPEMRRLRPSLPSTIQPIIEQAMSKRPADRYPTAITLFSELRTGSTLSKPGQPRAAWLAPVSGLVILGIMIVTGVFILRAPNRGAASPPETTEPLTSVAVGQPLPTSSPFQQEPSTDLPDSPVSVATSTTPIETIGGGMGLLGFNWNGLGYIVDVSCVLSGGIGCDPNPSILPSVEGVTPHFGDGPFDGDRGLLPNFSGWSYDGRYLAFGQDSTLFVLNYYEGTLIQVDPENGASYPLWSPNSLELAYLSSGDLYVSDLSCVSTGNGICATRGSLIFDYPARYPILYGWFADGSFMIRNPALVGQWGSVFPAGGVYGIDRDGSNLHFLAGTPGVQIGNSHAILSVDPLGGDWQVLNTSPDTIRYTDLTSNISYAIATIPSTEIVVSPDGRYLAYADNINRELEGDINLIDLQCIQNGFMGCNTASVKITDNDVGEAFLSFSPDGQWLAFIRGDHTQETEAIDCPGTEADPGCLAPRAAVATYDGDIYIVNVAEALENGTRTNASRITSIQFANFGPGFQGNFSLSWQPALP